MAEFAIDSSENDHMTESTRNHLDQTERNAEFIEVFADASPEGCERDPNLYKKPRAGQTRKFIKIDARYEAPHDPAIVMHTNNQILDEPVATILEQLLPLLGDYRANE